MDFSLTDEQRMIQDTACSLFTNECNLDFVRHAWSDRSKAATLWENHLSSWVDIGLGDVTDLALFMQEYGKAAAPGEFFASVLAVQVADAAGKTLSGSASVAVSAENGLWLPNESAQKYFVPSAGEVKELVVVAGSPEKPTCAIVSVEDLTVHEIDHMDRLRPNYRVDVSSVNDGKLIDAALWQKAVDRCLVAASAELIGVGRWLLDSAVEYAGERHQFGKPIGSFQGLQWKMVDAALELERAAAAVVYAAMCVDADDAERRRAVHSAKAEAGQAARHCARTSLQVHGGIGYTWEHGLHYWLKRAYAADAFMGSHQYHYRQLAGLIF